MFKCNRLSRLRIIFRSSPDKTELTHCRTTNKTKKIQAMINFSLHYTNILPSLFNMETVTVVYFVSDRIFNERSHLNHMFDVNRTLLRADFRLMSSKFQLFSSCSSCRALNQYFSFGFSLLFVHIFI